MGGLLAHYTIHPGSFCLPLVAKLIPYNWAKTWHLQLMIFWVATTWMASAIYLAPIIGGKDPAKQGLLVQVLFGAVLVVAFGFGLFYGKGSHLTMADCWRWFVVHFWVESIFEFFGIAVIALLMVAMGLATAKAALRVAYFTAALTFLSGIIGTAHHYFW